MNNPEHQMFKGNVDGARCPKCKGLVNIKKVTNEEYYELPEYRDLMKQNRVTYDEHEVKQALVAMGIDLDTSQFKLKLRAISKHTEALANELDAIDAAKCPNCGGTLEISEYYADGVIVDTSAYCGNCRD